MAPWIQELHFPTLQIPTTIDHITTVLPAAPIPIDTLYLSNLDDMIGTRVLTPTVYFYKPTQIKPHPKSVFKTLQESLAAVLVPYYPFSGRLREAQNSKLEVWFDPRNQGALMVEAHSDLALVDLGDVSAPNPAWTPLIYRFPDEGPYEVTGGLPLVIAQVTFFSCGGFSLGLRLCHCLCDGFGAMQFLHSWAATAKSGGKLIADPPPCWDREFFKPRNPPLVKFPHTEFMEIDDKSTLSKTLFGSNPLQKCYKLSREFQSKLKTAAENSICSSFDATAAQVWRSWVKALEIDPPNYDLRLTFSVNTRPKLKNPALKTGFYGNVVGVACAISSVSELRNGRLSETAKRVNEARVGITEEYLRSTVDYVEIARPKKLEFGGKLTIAQWTRFAIYEAADFGWGKPVYAGPIDLTPTPQVCLFLPQGVDDGGSTMVCLCLPESAAQKFKEELSMI